MLVWHRRSGKTTFAVIELILSAGACKREAPRFGYIAPFYGQAKVVAWELLKKYCRKIPGVMVRESELLCILPNGAQIRLYGADNPDALRGLYFDGVVMDEMADMKPSVWSEIIRPSLADRGGWALFIGTPRGVDHFSEIYQRALTSSDWFADLQTCKMTGAISDEELRSARENMSESHFRQEFECDFSADGEDGVISYESILRCYENPPPFLPSHTTGYCDFAAGGDENVLAIRVGNRISREDLVCWRDRDTMSAVGRFITEFQQRGLTPDQIHCDCDGLGKPMYDALCQAGWSINPIHGGSPAMDSATYANRVSEMWFSTAVEIEKRRIILPDDEILKIQLTSRRRERDSRGRLRLVGKDKLRANGGKSPDRADAVCGAITNTPMIAIDTVKGWDDPFEPEREGPLIGAWAGL